MAPTTANNVVWNLTIPDTSPMVQYGGDFVRQCPPKNGILQCTSGSAHISNSTTASFTINFYGTAIYLFGSVGAGSTYDTRLDAEPAVDGTVGDNNLLASYTGLRNSPEGEPLHGLVLTARQFRPDSVLTFTGAIISVDTGSPSAKTTLTNYDLTKPDSGVKLTPGWSHNGTYIQSGPDFSQQATLNFKGSGVMVYGLCTDTLQTFGEDFGDVLTDQSAFGISADISESSKPNGPYVADNCLLYYNTGFSEGEHNITYDSSQNNILLSSFQVLSVDAPKSSVPPAIASPKGGNSTSHDGGDATDLAIGIGGVVGIVAAAVGVVILLIVGTLCLRRRRRQRATMYSIPSAQSLPISETYPKPDDNAVVSQDALPVQAYTPSFPTVPSQQRPPSARYGAAARFAVPVSQPAGRARPQVATIATTGPAAVVQGAGEESPEDPYADPYAGMASYHADPFAAAVGGRTVLTAEGIHTLEDPELAQKARREAARATQVNRVGESSGSSGSRASRRQSVRPATVMTRSSQALPDVPPPLYEETDGRI